METVKAKACPTQPEELEPSFYSEAFNNRENRATVMDFESLERDCAMSRDWLSRVVDAEGETVCIAPRAIAAWIAFMLNQES